jgi:hypothetical protein
VAVVLTLVTNRNKYTYKNHCKKSNYKYTYYQNTLSSKTMFTAISNNIVDSASLYLAPLDTLKGLLLVFVMSTFVVLSPNIIVSSLSILWYTKGLYLVFI